MYSQILEEMFFTLEQIEMEETLKMELQETVLMYNRASLNEFALLHEGLKETIKDAIDNLLKAVEEMFIRFKLKAKEFADNNAKWLAENKEAILDGKDGKITIRKYWDRKNSLLEPLPRYDFSRLSESLGTDDDFIADAFKKFVPKDEGETYLDKAKEYYRGKEAENIMLNRSLLSIMYTYCTEYLSNVEKLLRQELEIKKAGKDGISKIRAAVSEGVDIVGDHYTILSCNEALLFEDTVKIDGDDNPANTATSAKVKDDKKASKDEIAKVKRYIKICTNIAGVKMTILEESYRNYIKIFKWIVTPDKPEKETKEDNKKEPKQKEDKVKKETNKK